MHSKLSHRGRALESTKGAWKSASPAPSTAQNKKDKDKTAVQKKGGRKKSKKEIDVHANKGGKVEC